MLVEEVQGEGVHLSLIYQFQNFPKEIKFFSSSIKST